MTAVNNATELWSIMIGIGVVVAICVVALLSLLAAFVRDIDHHVAGTAPLLQHVAANTATHLALNETAQLISALGAELQAHGRVLTGRRGAS